MLNVGEWPYMQEIDPDATSSFYGTATAVSKAGHAIFAFAFAFWARNSGMKIPLLAGRGICLVACICYLFVEFLPSNRRWWMMFCYFLFGVGYSASVLLRTYIARVSSTENRASAYALQNGASVLSVVVGPTPIWIALITNVIAIIFITVMFRNLDADDVQKSSEHSPKKDETGVLNRLKTLDLPWILILLVIVERFISQIGITTTSFLAAPILTIEYALTGEDTILALSISQCIVGILALTLSLSFYFFKLGTRVGCRLFFLLANILVVVGYLLTYPVPFVSSPMKMYNDTTKAGCDSATHNWCETELVTNLFVFLIIMILTLSFALPVSNLSLDTIYSKIVGHADQNLMQAVFVIADDISLIVAPIYSSQVFAAAGYHTVQIVNGSVYIGATVLWIMAWKRLGPFN
ncbi:hypothetical protein PRIPAC_78976 [Pristionchus pacificus]|uniref:Membrane transporter n=1 Tax=Pristionchus pacificus TaxID=54126 RepID=A0A2A6CPY1_PRIPA|nr:hypothetical protein PRIPAC_78976 [Pristionchus pacificus]|eukprot:PDM80199.1 membrane transporter [Pristionchus pacificus]